jgi:hypothetical protein
MKKTTCSKQILLTSSSKIQRLCPEEKTKFCTEPKLDGQKCNLDDKTQFVGVFAVVFK